MERVEAVEYQTEQGGTLTLRYDRPQWKVEDTNTGQTHAFASIPAFFAFCDEHYSWPMPTVVHS